jgi:hypothetical protein
MLTCACFEVGGSDAAAVTAGWFAEALYWLGLAIEISALSEAERGSALRSVLLHGDDWVPRESLHAVARIVRARGHQGVCAHCEKPGQLVPCARCGRALHGHCHAYRIESALWCWDCWRVRSPSTAPGG